MAPLIGFDIAKSTGVAILHADGSIETQSHNVERDTLQDTFKRFEDVVFRLLKAHDPDAIAVEAPIPPKATPNGFVTARLTFGLHGILGATATRFSLKLREVGVRQWRSAWKINIPANAVSTEAKRKAWKAAAVTRCRILGIDVANDDEADAVGVLEWLRGEMQKEALAQRQEAMF